MAGKILLEVVTPEHLLLSKQVDEVIAPGVDGEFGVLPGHAPFLTSLKIGELQYKMDNVWHYMSVLWGYAEVNQTKVTILAEVAEKAEDINVERAAQKVADAEQRLKTGGLPSDVKDAQISLEKARLRQKLAERARSAARH
ncbi:MAG: F0F1 ATP synthase subunit epsilon [Nitrospira sp.]|nr:F0F1 ATP synthase subunit epsilon [Nitrospira sp.]